MRSTIFYLGLCCLIMIFSCKETAPTPTVNPSDNLYKEVMRIHDDVMPEMGTIHRLKKELRTFQETADSSDKTILNQIQELDRADDAMMDWMAALNIPEGEKERYQYLESQLPLIQEVNDKMTQAISDASALVETLKSNHEN